MRGSIAMILAPLLLFVFLPSLIRPVAHTISPEAVWLVVVVWWWIVWSGTFIAFANYYLDVFIITDERILSIDQIGPFSRTISELRLERIQDVTIEQHGLLPTLLHFGTIRVETAGESPSFRFDFVPHPLAIKEIVMRANRTALFRYHREGDPSKAEAV